MSRRRLDGRGGASAGLLGDPQTPISPEPMEGVYELTGELGRPREKVFAAKFIRKRRRGRDCRAEVTHEMAVLEMARSSARVVNLVAAYETDHDIILVLEYAAGGEIFDHCVSDELLPESQITRLIRQTLEGVHHLHQSNLVHLDLKVCARARARRPFPRRPALLVSRLLCSSLSHRTSSSPACPLWGTSRSWTSAWLADWAPWASSGRFWAPQNTWVSTRRACRPKTSWGGSCPTPGSRVRPCDPALPFPSAPEILNYEPITTATDLWSVGVIAYMLVTGESPFAGDDKQETFLNVSQVSVDYSRDAFSRVSELAVDFIRKLLVKAPEDRPSAAECLSHPWLWQL
ncbi:unnamed protein product, partial [Tetraodon nigroviridis]